MYEYVSTLVVLSYHSSYYYNINRKIEPSRKPGFQHMLNKQQISKFIFETTNILKVQDFLQQIPDLDVREYRDRKQNNILHHLCFNDQKQLIKLYVVHTSRLVQRRIEASKNIYKKQTKHQIAAWVNQKNAEGFTPLLYASFNGHIELIHYLIEIGANIAASNNTKLNVLHMAAQNNKVSSLIYFQGKVDYNAVDQKGSTPLHWAAYSGSEQAAAFLLTVQKIKINMRDIQGQTPLLLATLFGNTKIVRRLLMKGAKRNIKNNKNQLPIQIARQNQFKNITKMLDDDYSCFDFLKFYYNVKLQYKPKSRSYSIPIVFIVTTICSLLILHGLIVYKEIYLYAIQGAVVGIMILLYLSLLVRPKQQQKENLVLYINQTKKICFECLRKKPKRSYHCDTCKTCIEQYDHHCTWINNCVGKRNIARFIIFIFFLLASLAIIGITSAWGIIVTVIPDVHIMEQWLEFRDQTHQGDQWQKLGRAVLFAVNIGVSLFSLPVLLLFLMQIKNLLINKTTYERIRGDNSTVRDQLKKRKKKGPSLANCKAMCSRTRQSFSTDQSLQQRMLEPGSS